MFLHKKMTVNHKISGELLSDKPKNVPRCTKSSTNRMWYDISWHLACLYKTSIISNMIQATSPAHLGSPNGSTSWHLLAAGQPSNTWLVVGFYPSKNHGVKVSWGDDIPFPIWWESHKSHVPNHQRVIFNELNESKGPCSKLFLDFQRVDPRTVSEPPLNKKDVFPSVSSVENEEMCKTYIQKCTYVSIP